nr:retrovirus-related Pol polyprotein from transposon TNT 1-94 [Tanacetum cinerariifolium]
MNMSQDRQIQNVKRNGGNQFGQYAGQVASNQQGYNAWHNWIANLSGSGNVVAARAKETGMGNQAMCYNYRGLGIQLQAEEFDFIATAGDLDEIEEANANCILMENLQNASTSGSQLDKAPYTDLLEPIPEPQLVPQNDNHVTSIASSMVQSGGTVETSSAPNEETRAHQETNYHNLVEQVAQWCVDSGCSKHMTGDIKLLINFVWKFLGTVRFGYDHIAAILGYGDLKWGNITITRVYFVKGLCHNLFSIGLFCDADLEVAFKRNTCFIRDLDGVDLLKGNRSTNLYTINLYDMALASSICLMAHATPTKSWLWHQRLSQLNLDTINDLAKNDLVSDLSKFKYVKEHLCPSCEKGKSKRASHPTQTCLEFKSAASSASYGFVWSNAYCKH